MTIYSIYLYITINQSEVIMNKIQAQKTLDKLNVTIEDKIIEHRDGW